MRGRKLHKQIENYTVLPQQTRLVRLNRRDNHNSRNLFCERRHQTLPESAAGPHGPVRCPAPAWPGSHLASLPVRGREQGPAQRLIREDARHLRPPFDFSVDALHDIGGAQQATVRFWKRKHHKTWVPVLFYTMAVKGNMPVITLLLGKGTSVSESPKGDLRNTELSDHTCRPGRTLQDRRHLRRGHSQLTCSGDNIP